MSKISNGDISVYYETEGTGPAVVLQHGWSGSLECWREFGYTSALRDAYRLVLIDARGHGRSGVPSNKDDYDTERMATDVICVLDALNIGRAHFVGYSMGGWIGFHLGSLAPNRFISMVLGGAHPYEEDLSFIRDLAAQGGAAILGFWDSAFSDEIRQQLTAHPSLPLTAAVRNDRPDLSPSLGRMRMPLLIYAGDQDFRYEGVKRCGLELPNAEFLSIPGLEHLLGFTRSDLVIPHVRSFLDRHSAEAVRGKARA